MAKKKRKTLEEWEEEQGLKDVPKEQVNQAIEKEYGI
jgi:hypothetical protein